MEKFLQALEQFAEILLRFVRNEDGRLRESRPVPQDSTCLGVQIVKSIKFRGCFNLSYKERDSDDPRLTQIHGYILSPLYKPGHATVFFDSPQNRVSEYRKIDFRIFLFFRILSISKRIQ